jgi:hypothetical protein
MDDLSGALRTGMKLTVWPIQEQPLAVHAQLDCDKKPDSSYACFGNSSNSLATILSAPIPSACAEKVGTNRCRSTGGASASMSLAVT